MALQQANGIQPVEGAFDGLTALLAGHLTGAMLHLYQGGFAPTMTSVAADFAAHECNFTGYAAQALTWSAVGLDGTGQPVALSNRAFFQATDAVAPNVVAGCWITHDVTGPPATHTAMEYYPFPGPVNMNAALDALGVVIGMALPGSPGYAIVDN